MQTFIPVTSSFADIAEVLDNKRLNKQALEGWQIMMTNLKLDPQGNHREPKGWYNHPAAKMWRGHEQVLWQYIMAMTDEWLKRGFKTTIGDKATATLDIATQMLRVSTDMLDVPEWLHNEDIASTHRLALLVKDYEWYSQFGWSEDPGYHPTDYEYIWPE